MKKLQWTGTVLVLICIMLLAACSSQTPGSVTKAFYQALASGNVDAAIAMVDFVGVKGNEMAMAKAKVKLVAVGVQTKMGAAGGLKSIDITKTENTDATHAKVYSTLHFGDGSKKKDTTKLVRTDGQWRISLL